MSFELKKLQFDKPSIPSSEKPEQEKLKTESVYFFESQKDNKIICRTEGGKISFVDNSYGGIMPQKEEKWAVKIIKKLEKVNIIRPLFKIDETAPVEKLLGLGSTLRIDFFNGELIVYDGQKEIKRFLYDGRWDNKMFFSSYSLPEAIRLHKLSKEIVESGKTAIIVDQNGKLVTLSPPAEKYDEYDYFCHIHKADGKEKNFAFVNKEAEEKWNQFMEKIKQDFFSQMDSPPADYWNNEKIARVIGIPDRQQIEISVLQKFIGSSQSNNFYREVTVSTETSWTGRPTEESVCQACGKKSGGKTLIREKDVWKCPFCNATQNKLWGNEGDEITDTDFLYHSDKGITWHKAEQEIYTFPYEDQDIKGELIITVAPEIGVSYLQKYKILKVTDRIMHIHQIKRKCMRPNSIIVSSSKGVKSFKTRYVEKVETANAEFPSDFTSAEKYVCGWLPQEYFYQEKEGVYSPEKIHKEICNFLADTSEYFAEDIPTNVGMVKEILQSMMAEKRIDFLPPDKEIESLYPFFLEDWISEGMKKKDFPSESEWMVK